MGSENGEKDIGATIVSSSSIILTTVQMTKIIHGDVVSFVTSNPLRHSVYIYFS